MSTTVKDALEQVKAAQAAFEARHTQLELEQADPAFADLLKRQRNLFDKATVTGTIDAVIRHRDGMLRGYGKAADILDKVKADGSRQYETYRNERTGRTIVIGLNRAGSSTERFVERFGKGTVYLTALEAAALLDRLKAFDAIAEVKQRWPDAEVLPLTSSDDQ